MIRRPRLRRAVLRSMEPDDHPQLPLSPPSRWLDRHSWSVALLLFVAGLSALFSAVWFRDQPLAVIIGAGFVIFIAMVVLIDLLATGATRLLQEPPDHD